MIDGRIIQEIEEIKTKEFVVGDVWPDLIQQERQFIVAQLAALFLRFPSVSEVKSFPLKDLEEIFKTALKQNCSTISETLYKLILIKSIKIKEK